MRIDKRPSRLRQNKRLGLKQIRDIASAISLISCGGVGEIRTLASLTTPNDLANRPLQPLEYHSTYADWFSIHWERFLCQAECWGYFFKISSTAATFRVIMFVCPGRMSAFIMTSVRIPFSAK